MATDTLKTQYNNLQEENEQYKKLISHQRDLLASLDREVAVLESSLQEKVTGVILKQQREHRRQRKHIRILENKLNQDTITFDKLMYSNMDYRKDIASMMEQRGFMCHMEDKFKRQLATQRNIREVQEERSTRAFNQRSEAETRMLEMRKCIKEETVEFTKRRMKLKTVIAHDAKLQTFLEMKFQEITPLEEKENSKKRKQEQQYQDGVEKLEMYVQERSRLLEVTGEGDLRQIGLMFTQNEQKIFVHISYINLLRNRRNMLKKRTDKMKSDILFLEEENREHDEEMVSQLKDLESELEKNCCLAESLKKQHTVVQRTLDQLTTAISGLLDMIMEEAPIINFDNMVRFTSVLEESINDLLIQANNVDDEQTESAPRDVLLANFDLLPGEAVMETERCRST